MRSMTVQVRGSYTKTEAFLKKAMRPITLSRFEKYGEEGVRALADATPRRTGQTAASWGYTLEETPTGIILTWTNSNLGEDWAPIAVLLDIGHATRNGGYVQGLHYIEPALQPVFERIMKEMWKELIS